MLLYTAFFYLPLCTNAFLHYKMQSLFSITRDGAARISGLYHVTVFHIEVVLGLQPSIYRLFKVTIALQKKSTKKPYDCYLYIIPLVT